MRKMIAKFWQAVLLTVKELTKAEMEIIWYCQKGFTDDNSSLNIKKTSHIHKHKPIPVY